MPRTIRSTDEFKVEVVNGANTSNLSITTTSGGVKTLSFDGDLEILGTTSEIQSTQLNIEDNLITLSRTNSGGADVDAGILIERVSSVITFCKESLIEITESILQSALYNLISNSLNSSIFFASELFDIRPIIIRPKKTVENNNSIPVLVLNKFLIFLILVKQ